MKKLHILKVASGGFCYCGRHAESMAVSQSVHEDEVFSNAPDAYCQRCLNIFENTPVSPLCGEGDFDDDNPYPKP